jgi:hypothetical protein
LYQTNDLFASTAVAPEPLVNSVTSRFYIGKMSIQHRVSSL